MEGNGFYEAKINDEGKNVGPEYVLCLYYKMTVGNMGWLGSTRRCRGVKYRYWKSDSDTREGKYSTMFLSKLEPAQREAFTKPE